MIICIFLDIREVWASEDQIYTKMARRTQGKQKISRKDAVSVLSRT